MSALTEVLLSIPLRWWIVSGAGVIAVGAACLFRLESDASRAKRARRKQEKELRALADTISTYGKSVHQRFPTGAVVVNERDLAEQLRKRPEAIVTALNLLLNEHRVQSTQLSGYWRLNV